MTLQIQGTGQLLVVVLGVIALLLIGLLWLAATTGKVRTTQAWVCSGLVVLVVSCVLGYYAWSGGDFPRLVRGRPMLPRTVPTQRLGKGPRF